MTLQEAMIGYRAKYNLSMEKFAKIAGLSTQTVMQVERGYQKPSRITLAKITRVLKGNMKGVPDEI